MNTQAQALAALETALGLIQDAMECHIYDVDNGEYPEDDCGYLLGCCEIQAAIDAIKAQA